MCIRDSLLIGQGIAEQIKWQIGSAYPLQPEKTMEVRGRNLVTGLPETVEVSSVEIRESLSASVQVIIDTVRDALDEIPPEIVSDLMDIGICLAGGGAYSGAGRSFGCVGQGHATLYSCLRHGP